MSDVKPVSELEAVTEVESCSRQRSLPANTLASSNTCSCELHVVLVCSSPCCAAVTFTHAAACGCRFNDVFARDEQHMPRNWSPSANIPAIAQQARQSAARLLALLAVIRLHSVKVCSLLQCCDTASVFWSMRMCQIYMAAGCDLT